MLAFLTQHFPSTCLLVLFRLVKVVHFVTKNNIFFSLQCLFLAVFYKTDQKKENQHRTKTYKQEPNDVFTQPQHGDALIKWMPADVRVI